MHFHMRFTRAGEGIAPNQFRRPGLPRYWEIVRIEWWNLVKLGCLTFVCCLPVVTIPAALAAMTVSFCAMIADRPQFLAHDYLAAFRAQFRRATLPGGLYLLLAILCGAAAYLYLFVLKGSSPFFTASGLLMLFSLQVVLFAAFYAFVMLVKTDLPFGSVFRNSLLLVFLRESGRRQAVVFVGELTAALLLFWFSPYSILLSIPFLLPLLLLLGTYFAWLGLEKHVFRKGGEAA
jgi:uncharacterized membrane protein YesL